jgi:4-hydroxy-tetrahydrodipicolinate synthase
VAPDRSLAVWNALEAGDYARARAVVESIADFETMRTKYRNGANVTVVKEALQIQGLAVGDVRLPGLPKLETADRKALEKVVAGWETDAIV